MQSGSQVQVVEVDDDGSAGRSLGPAALVTPDVAVMKRGNREPLPSLPLRVLVPAAAGGGRDGHDNVRGEHAGVLEIEVCKVHASADGSDHVGFELASPAPDALTEQAALRGHGQARPSEPWWCKIIPFACR